MKLLTIIAINQDEFSSKNENIQVLHTNAKNLISTINDSEGKYISFVVEKDLISNDYEDLIINKIKSMSFDACYINYELKLTKALNNKRRENDTILNNKISSYDYIWNYVYKKDLLLKLLNSNNQVDFNLLSNELFKTYTNINNNIYTHVDYNSNNNYLLSMSKENQFFKNIIYMGDFCNGIFNGYITWLKNIGKCFIKEYEIMILYDNIPEIILDEFKKYFTCVKYGNKVNYLCETLICTYSTYYYPNNIYCYKESVLFIHGNMSDYEHAIKYKDDIYSRYVAVSKESRDKAIGYYPTKEIEIIYNPYKTEKVNGALKLVSAQRSTGVKKIERIEYMAQILDELDIPYTWNLFTDTKENTNKNGLIFRKRTPNVLPYVKESDYLVQFSDSEALSYSVIEALCLNKKVIVTPLNCFKELNIEDGKNGYIIPFDYFEEKNKELFKKKLRDIYLNKDIIVNYNYDENRYQDYRDIFVK